MASLIVFPAIDLKGGQVVRLAEGDMDRATVYGDDPAQQAMIFSVQGAEHLHVVDLDGAFAGKSVNGEAVAAIVAQFPGHVQLGGGIRTPEAVEGCARARLSVRARQSERRQRKLDIRGGAGAHHDRTLEHEGAARLALVRRPDGAA